MHIVLKPIFIFPLICCPQNTDTQTHPTINKLKLTDYHIGDTHEISISFDYLIISLASL